MNFQIVDIGCFKKLINKILITKFFILLFSGCALFNRLEPICESVNEEEYGELYAKQGTNIANFDVFANQCAKYGYRTPSREKFMKSYTSYQKNMCSSPAVYFKSSYKLYSAVSVPKLCGEIGIIPSYNDEEVRDDAYYAYELKKSVEDLDSKINKAMDNNGTKKYDNGFIMDSLLRAAHESDPTTLRERRSEKIEDLKKITKKYNLFISDLD